MIILPLGLGLKLFRLPIVTMILITVNIMWFYHEGAINGKFISDVHKAQPFAQIEYQLFYEFCKNKLAESSCKIGEDFIHQKYSGLWPENLRQYSSPSKTQKTTWKDFEDILEDSAGKKQILNSEIFAKYKETKKLFYDNLKAKQIELSILSKNSTTIESVGLAQFRHGSSLHLYSNIFFLLTFGIYAECALGSLVYLIFYLLGGTAGLILQIVAYDNSITFVVGASANVSAVMGAFYVLFFRHYFKALFFMVFYFKTFLAPVSITLPILFFSQDLIGVLEIQGTNVAHLAHLGGLISGIILTYFYKIIFLKVPPPYIYKYEYKKTRNLIEAENIPDNMISEATKILEVNPMNSAILGKSIEHSLIIKSDHSEFIRAKNFIEKYFSNYLTSLYKKNQIEIIFNILSIFPNHFSIYECLRKIDQRILGKLIKSTASNNIPYTKFILITSYLYHSKSNNELFLKKIENKLNNLIKNNDFSTDELNNINSFNQKYGHKINFKIQTMISEKLKLNTAIA